MRVGLVKGLLMKYREAETCALTSLSWSWKGAMTSLASLLTFTHPFLYLPASHASTAPNPSCLSPIMASSSSSSSKAANVIQAHAVHVAHEAKEAVISHTYLYPPLGALYLLRHPSLWPPLLKKLPACLILSVVVVGTMFLVTYVPQAAVLSFVDGPLGPINAAMLVLSESSVIVNALAKSFLLEHALYDIFDATLICEGQDALVAKGREVKPGRKSDGAKKLGKLITKPLTKYD